MKNEFDNIFGKYVSPENGSRWSSQEEIMNAPTMQRINIVTENCPVGGIPVISDRRTAYVNGSDMHAIIFGATGSKKTRIFVMPLIKILALADESFIATDPKGELFHKTAPLVAAKGYKTIVLNFRNPKESNTWNPLQLPYFLYHNGKTEEAISLLNDFIHALAEPHRRQTNDRYWIDLGCSQFLANLLFFIETATPEEANIYSFVNFFTKTCSVTETVKLADIVAEGSIASLNYNSVLTNKEADRTFANVSSTVMLMLSPFIVRKSLCQVLSKSSFDVRDASKTKTAIYVIVPDEKTTMHFLATLFIKQTYEALINEAQQMENKKLPVRVNFVLDEFCNIPKIEDMPAIISAARSRNIRFFLMVQGLKQLKQKYNEDAETIIGNCENLIFLTSREYALLQEISNLCGNMVHYQPDGKRVTTPLISVSDLQRLKKECGEALIIHGRNYPYVTELPDIDEYMFNEYPPVEVKENSLPKIVLYDAKKVIDEIETNKRPIPFSVEVHGEERFYAPPVANSLKDIFAEWNNQADLWNY